jgi:hypothetical protein
MNVRDGLWKRLCLVGCLVIGGLLVCGSVAMAGKQLLFEVRSNQYATSKYQFFALTRGAKRKLMGLRYMRWTRRRVAVWTSRKGKRRRVIQMRYTPDLCYPFDITYRQIARGYALTRHSKPPKVPDALKALRKRHRLGLLKTGQKAVLKRLTRSYCQLFRKPRKGRLLNSLKGYGFRSGSVFSQASGGLIVVTYLRNALLNFFRGSYRYVVLRVSQRNGKWFLTTNDGRSSSSLFFRAFSLGISGVELHDRVGAQARTIHSYACKRGVHKRHGMCLLTPRDIDDFASPVRSD